MHKGRDEAISMGVSLLYTPMALVVSILAVVLLVNFDFYRPDPTQDLRTIAIFEALAYLSAILLPLLLFNFPRKYKDSWLNFIFCTLLWIASVAMAVLNIVLVNDFASLDVEVVNGQLSGHYANAMYAMITFSWFAILHCWFWTIAEITLSPNEVSRAMAHVLF